MDYKYEAAERRERKQFDLETEKARQLKRIADSLDMLLSLIGPTVVTSKEGNDIEDCKRFLQSADVRTDD